ncbi:MAG: DUF3455 domain-containing protein [Burkholderiaceae bacterium]
MRSLLPLLLTILALAGCSTPGPIPGGSPDAPRVTPPAIGLFSKIAAPDHTRPVLQLRARGVQIFRCERDKEGWYWVFRQPEAQLLDSNERPVGRHGAGFSFDHADGSRLTGQVQSWQDAPDPAGDLKWLLLVTRSAGRGAFAGVTHVQRVNAQGGQPLAGCEAAQSRQLLRVPFEADFVFFKPR